MDNDKLEQYRRLYFQNGYEVPYALKCGYILNIKPISVSEIELFSTCIETLTIKKNRINDIDILQMNYIKFLKEIVFANGKEEQQIYKFVKLFEMCFNETNVQIDGDSSEIMLCDENDVCKARIKSKELTEITKIILNQNYYNYDNREVDEEVEKAKDEYLRLISKNRKTPNLEEKKVYVMSKTSYDILYINNMLYRFFDMIYNQLLSSDIYLTNILYKTSEKYKVDADIKHPLYQEDEDVYDKVFVDRESVAKKLG